MLAEPPQRGVEPSMSPSPESPHPLQIVVHKQSREVEFEFSDGQQGRLGFEFLRVYSPSAEVRGHGAGQEVLQTGKQGVSLLGVEPVGNYAVRLVFSDGHDSGLYTWDYLHGLLRDQEALWAQYLARLEAAGGSREVATPSAPKSTPCGKH